MTPRQLEFKAGTLAREFYNECQALFNDPAMTQELADGEVFSLLVLAQGYAQDITELNV